MNSSTSIGRGPAHGSNENKGGDPRSKTLGEDALQEDPPAGSESVDRGLPPDPATDGKAGRDAGEKPGRRPPPATRGG